MKRTVRHIAIVFFAFINVTVSNAQKKVQGSAFEALNTIPQEHIYMHLNSTLFLTGEYAYYKIYCLDSQTKDLSKISKVAYVQLISASGEKIVEQKLLLTNGEAYGDFFLPTTLNTGSYTLIAYTNWMRNYDEDHFYRTDVHIINPYRPLDDENSSDQQIALPAHTTISIAGQPTQLTSELSAKTDKEHYRQREKVVLSFKSEEENQLANLSISVRKIDNLPRPSSLSLKEVINQQNVRMNQNDGMFLPELRGEIICGKLSSQDGRALGNLKIALSIPGSRFHAGITTTNNDGSFYFNVNSRYSLNTFAFQVIDADTDDFRIELCSEEPFKTSFTPSKEVYINETMRDEILDRSIHNQLENAYFQYRLDEVMPNQEMRLFQNWEATSYLLDDYTRFKTIEETIFEYVKNVFVRRDGDVKKIQIQGLDFDASSGIPPLIILDGIILQQHNQLLEQNAINFEEITVYRNQFVFGPQTYQGVLVLRSNKTLEYFLDGNIFEGLSLITTQNFVGLKKYARQTYSDDQGVVVTRIPDDRYQILWEPNFELSNDNSSIEFFTSDITGEFEVCVEGLMNDGTPISVKQTFWVKQ